MKSFLEKIKIDKNFILIKYHQGDWRSLIDIIERGKYSIEIIYLIKILKKYPIIFDKFDKFKMMVENENLNIEYESNDWYQPKKLIIKYNHFTNTNFFINDKLYHVYLRFNYWEQYKYESIF